MRIKFLIRWGMLEALSTSRNLEKQHSVKNAIRAQPLTGLFWANMHEILAPFLKLNYMNTLFSTFLHYEEASASLQSPGGRCVWGEL